MVPIYKTGGRRCGGCHSRMQNSSLSARRLSMVSGFGRMPCAPACSKAARAEPSAVDVKPMIVRRLAPAGSGSAQISRITSTPDMKGISLSMSTKRTRPPSRRNATAAAPLSTLTTRSPARSMALDAILRIIDWSSTRSTSAARPKTSAGDSGGGRGRAEKKASCAGPAVGGTREPWAGDIAGDVACALAAKSSPLWRAWIVIVRKSPEVPGVGPAGAGAATGAGAAAKNPSQAPTTARAFASVRSTRSRVAAAAASSADVVSASLAQPNVSARPLTVCAAALRSPHSTAPRRTAARDAHARLETNSGSASTKNAKSPRLRTAASTSTTRSTFAADATRARADAAPRPKRRRSSASTSSGFGRTARQPAASMTSCSTPPALAVTPKTTRPGRRSSSKRVASAPSSLPPVHGIWKSCADAAARETADKGSRGGAPGAHLPAPRASHHEHQVGDVAEALDGVLAVKCRLDAPAAGRQPRRERARRRVPDDVLVVADDGDAPRRAVAHLGRVEERPRVAPGPLLGRRLAVAVVVVRGVAQLDAELDRRAAALGALEAHAERGVARRQARANLVHQREADAPAAVRVRARRLDAKVGDPRQLRGGNAASRVCDGEFVDIAAEVSHAERDAARGGEL
ncbi:hypothetical protein M885DRAFT_259762 [Pelagophyceae sp. CCMP2097]|nr:hypothetical protein M885DRAFT_259762 [Pelagophyceae sp. CCMP2097]